MACPPPGDVPNTDSLCKTISTGSEAVETSAAPRAVFGLGALSAQSPPFGNARSPRLRPAGSVLVLDAGNTHRAPPLPDARLRPTAFVVTGTLRGVQTHREYCRCYAAQLKGGLLAIRPRPFVPGAHVVRPDGEKTLLR